MFDGLAARKGAGIEAGRETHRRSKFAATATAAIYAFASEGFKWTLGYLVCMQVNLTSGSQEATNLVAASVPGGITHQGIDAWTVRALAAVTDEDGVVGLPTRTDTDVNAASDNTGTYDTGNCAIGGDFERPVITNNLISHWIEPDVRCVQKVRELGPLHWKWWSTMPATLVELATGLYAGEPVGTATEAQLVQNEVNTFLATQLDVVCAKYAKYDGQTGTFSIEFMGDEDAVVGATGGGASGGGGGAVEEDTDAIVEKECDLCGEKHPFDPAKPLSGAKKCRACKTPLPGINTLKRRRVLAKGPKEEPFAAPAAKRYHSQPGLKVSTYDLITGRVHVEYKEPSIAARAPGAGASTDQFVKIEAAPPNKMNPGLTQNQLAIRDALMRRLRVGWCRSTVSKSELKAPGFSA